jgi:hypothetical protein
LRGASGGAFSSNGTGEATAALLDVGGKIDYEAIGCSLLVDPVPR